MNKNSIIGTNQSSAKLFMMQSYTNNTHGDAFNAKLH